jgi:hypothetical protein
MVGDRGVEDSDSAPDGEQSLPALEDDNGKESYDKDDEVSNFFVRGAGLIGV